jgi:hypothetical protein
MQRPSSEITQDWVPDDPVGGWVGKVIGGKVGRWIGSDGSGGIVTPVLPASELPEPSVPGVELFVPGALLEPLPEPVFVAGFVVLTPGVGTPVGSVGTVTGDSHGWHGTGPRSSVGADWRQLQPASAVNSMARASASVTS